MIPRTLKEHTSSPARQQAAGFAGDQLPMFTMMLNKYNMTEKFNTAEKYNCEWRKNTLRQPARREAGAVIQSFNFHLICMLRQKTLHTGIEGGSREAIEAKRVCGKSDIWGVCRSNISLTSPTSPYIETKCRPFSASFLHQLNRGGEALQYIHTKRSHQLSFFLFFFIRQDKKRRDWVDPQVSIYADKV